MPKGYLQITEFSFADGSYYPIGRREAETVAMRDTEFNAAPTAAPGDIPRSSENRVEYEWHLEMLEPSGMIEADKAISQRTVERVLGCSVETARESARDRQKFELHLPGEEWARLGWA